MIHKQPDLCAESQKRLGMGGDQQALELSGFESLELLVDEINESSNLR